MNQTVKALVSLLIISAVSLGLLWGSDVLTRGLLEEQATSRVAEIFGDLLEAKRYQELDTGNREGVTAAYAAKDDDDHITGYAVTVSVQGYVGEIEVHAAVAPDGEELLGIRIGAHQETAGYGARITSALFIEQFENVQPPLQLAGAEADLRDGIWRAEAEEEDNGFRDVVEITLKNGEITSVNWDGVNEAGDTKKALSRAGQYVMSETGLPWHEQAEIVEQALLRLQNPAMVEYDPDTGRTDAYSGATIRISPFVKLAEKALRQARGSTTTGTSVDGLSGATASSKAVIAASNTAVEYVQWLVKQ